MKKLTKAMIGLALITGFSGAVQAGGYDRYGNYYQNVQVQGPVHHYQTQRGRVYNMNQVDHAKAQRRRLRMNWELSQIKNERLDRAMERRLQHERQRQLGDYPVSYQRRW